MPDAGENFEATFEPTDSPAGRVIDATQDEPTPTLEFEAPDSLPVLAVSRTLDTAHPDSAVEYSASAVDYFSRTAFGVEYGESEPVLHKWTDDLRISVLGTPTVADLATLRELIDELNILLPDLELRLVDQHANVEMHILPETEFKVVEPEYVETNLGFFRVWWDDAGAIYRARILIASQGITPEERSHLIREELTQSLGLFRDSWTHPDSMFYQGWTATDEFSSLDRSVIGMLYSPQITPGMDRPEALAALNAPTAVPCCVN